MSFSRPRSFLQLVLLGFVLVTLPLIIAIINAILSVDRLAAQSEQAVLAAAEITRHSQDIVEQLIDMERKARQYDVLGDVALFVAYKTAHEQFVSMTSDLGRLPLDEKQQQDFQILIATEREVFQALGGASGPEIGPEKKRFARRGREKTRHLQDTSGYRSGFSKISVVDAICRVDSQSERMDG